MKEKFRKGLNLVAKNLSHIFSALGILLTLYFGFYYVPDWVVEEQNVRIINSQKNLEQSIKELIFSESSCTLNEIKILVKAKEIENDKEDYNIDINNTLTKVQESFMQDKFLPLEIRRELIAEIEVIKKEDSGIDLDSVTVLGYGKSVSFKQIIFTFFNSYKIRIISSLITIIIVVLGIFGYWLRLKDK